MFKKKFWRSLKKKLKKRKKQTLIIALFLFFLFLFYWLILKDLPSPKNLESKTAYSSSIYDRQGKLLYQVYLEKNRSPVNLEELPKYVKEATIAIEDKDFYKHHGFSSRGIIRAFFNTIFRRQLQGGSTITQQLVKNGLLTQKRTLQRKIKEAILTIVTESIYSKDEILNMYFNQTPYGGTAWGIEAASRLYFDKSARDLSLAEAAFLAGLPASPTTFSPFGAHPELAKKRQELVLERMVELNFINEDEAKKAKEEKLKFAKIKEPIRAPHFVMFVKEQLVEKFGKKMVYEGGLKVTTSLDLKIQDFAQETVASQTSKLKELNVTNGAVLVTNPQTGEILAMVGSKDYFNQEEEGNFNVTTAYRQPGSAIKPINYAVAIDQGKITAATPLVDTPTCFIQKGQPIYCPTNYDYSYHGAPQARFALGNSYNIPAVKVLALNGLDNFIKMARQFGITTFKDPSRYGLSLTLGGGEVKMVDMAVAFGTLANLGVKKPLVSILKVEDKNGKVLLDNTPLLGEKGERVISQEAAYIVSHILLDNNARSAAFGPSSYLVVKNHPEVAVKTGTTNDLRDNWTIGYTPHTLVAVWVGNNDNSPMSRVASGVTGASPVWNKIISFVLDEYHPQQDWLSKPEDIVGALVCLQTGKLKGESNCPARFEYFIKGKLPEKQTSEKENILINKETQTPVQPGENPAEKEEQEHLVARDPLGIIYCFDCPQPQKPVNILYPLPASLTSR